MYEDFYNLKEKPFNLTPSPRFLYLSEGHKEALSLMKYGVMDRMGFILLTGEVGTGKTTIVRTLLDSLDDSVKYVHLSNPLLTPEDLLNYLALSTFRKEGQFSSKTHFLLVFQAYLQQAVKDQTNFNLIIDEAHKLSFDLLEEIRLLSNMETGDEKLINIFLVGQPELNKNLSDPACRALLQRISVRYHIPPLNLEETRNYMKTRLEVAGAKKGDSMFSKSAVEALYNLSRGFPREINVLADNALLLGYAKGIKKITPSIVRECYEDLQIEDRPTKKDSQKIEFEKIEESEPINKTRIWHKAAVFLLCLVFVMGALSSPGKRILSQLLVNVLSGFERVSDTSAGNPGTAKREADQISQETAKMDLGEVQGPLYEKNNNEGTERVEIAAGPGEETISEETEFNELSMAEMDDAEGVPESVYEKDETDLAEMSGTAEEPGREYLPNVMLSEDDAKISNLIESESSPLEQDKGPSATTLTVKQGDTLTLMALAVYRRANEDILELVHRHNPGIEDIDWIYEGQKITFPPLSESNKAAIFTVHIASYEPFEPAFEMSQKLMKAGYEAYLMPANHPDRGAIYRLTLGAFKTLSEARDYAVEILDRGVSDYAKAVQLDMK